MYLKSVNKGKDMDIRTYQKDKEELKNSKYKITELKNELDSMKKTVQPRAFSNLRGNFARDMGSTTHQTRFKGRLKSLGGHTLMNLETKSGIETLHDTPQG